MKKYKSYDLYGVDKSKELIKNLKNKKFITYEKNLLKIFKSNKNKNVYFSTEIKKSIKYNVIIICVGTPINNKKNINNKFLFSAINSIKKSIDNNTLIVIRSTVKIGTTKKIFSLIKKSTSKTFNIAYCPERTIEGNAIEEISTLPQLIGCEDINSKKIATNFFKKITKKVINFDTFEEPELIKLLDNSYRDSKFAFANQISIICEEFNLNSNNIIKSANENFSRNMIPIPGPVGGPCLSKDPYILNQSMKSDASLIIKSREINERFIDLFTKKILLYSSKLNRKKINFSIVGISFKGNPDTNDIRDSTAIKIIDKIKLKYPLSKIYVYDKFVELHKIKNLGCIKLNKINDCFDKEICIIHGNNSYIKAININQKIRKSKNNVIVFDLWNNYLDQIDLNLKQNYVGLGF